MNRNLMFGIALFFCDHRDWPSQVVRGKSRLVWDLVMGCFPEAATVVPAVEYVTAVDEKGLFARLHSRRSDCGGETEVAAPDPAPSCGGRKSCHGGLLARLRAKLAERKAARNLQRRGIP